MRAGDIVTVHFGTPIGSEAGFRRPAVIITADAFLHYRPTTVLAVPLTSTARTFPSHIPVAVDEQNALDNASWILVEQLRAVAIERCGPVTGNVGSVVIHQVLDVLAMITGIS